MDFFIFLKDFIYSFLRDTQTERERERERGRERKRMRGRAIGRGRSRLPVGSPMQDSISGPQDHELSQRLTLNH